MSGTKNCHYDNGILYAQKINMLKKELFRKTIHLAGALIPTLLKYLYWPVLAALASVLVVYIISEKLRLKGRKVPLISIITETAARKRDENKFVLGPVTLTLGIIITSLLWKPENAQIGIYALAFGDGLASLFGKLFGHSEIPFTSGKTAEGSLTCFIAIFISSFAVCKNTSIALILAATGMFIELLPLKDFDNILIPIAIGGLSQLLM